MLTVPGSPASPWVERHLAAAPAGPVLDVACGSGRHVRLALWLGRPVTAIDRDVSGLADLDGARGLEIVRADLEDGSPWPLPGRRFAAVIVTNYLHRPLFPALLAALQPGGTLIYETFAVGNERYGKPSRPDFLLRPGELLEMAQAGGLAVAAYEHGHVAAPRPAVIQRLCAVAGDAADRPP